MELATACIPIFEEAAWLRSSCTYPYHPEVHLPCCVSVRKRVRWFGLLTHAAHAAHIAAAKLAEVVLGRLVLLVLVEPLVKVGLEEVDLL